MTWFLFCILFYQALAQSSPNLQNATAFSLLYGYPLLAWQKAFVPVIADVGTNEWQHARQLSTAADRDIVKPNVDTLYSRLIYDLSQSNIEITVPEIPDYEFKLFSFYDPYGDNFVNIGTGGFYQPGKYLVRPYDRPGGIPQVGLQQSNGSSSSYVATVSSPTPYGYLLVRWGVNNTSADTVHQWQNECKSVVLSPSKDITDENLTQLKDLVDVYNTKNSPAENVLNLLAKYAPPNSLSDQFKAAGIANGQYTPVPTVNLTAANATAVKMVTAAAANPQNINRESNGWSVLSPKYVGVYGTNYALRTLIADTGYLALRNPYAVYPSWANTSSGSANALLSLTSNEAIMFTFSGKPPLQEAGFWSLTAYGSDYYLIPNSMDVYALGDRSNLTYSDGTRIYNTSSKSGSSNRTFQILLQPADVAPPANWTNNWLPAPSGGGDVVAQLRYFVAKQSLIDGSYEYPLVEKVAAITNGSGASGGSSGGTGAGHSINHAASRLSWIAVMVLLACVIGGTVTI